MPNRLIREGLLDSERYWSVTIEARQLFIHLMLLADDIGFVCLAPLFVRRRCFDDRPSDEKLAKLLQELQDADLIRVYHHDGARFGFIPRFRQRIQVRHMRYPAPPDELLQGDTDAQQKLQSIKARSRVSSDAYPRNTVAQPCEAETEAEAKTEERQWVIGATDPARPGPPVCPHDRIVALYHENLPTLPRVRHWTEARRKQLAARWREMASKGHYQTADSGLDWWGRLFSYVGECPFLVGRAPVAPGRQPFFADLEWLVRSANFVKVLEGKYEDKLRDRSEARDAA